MHYGRYILVVATTILTTHHSHHMEQQVSEHTVVLMVLHQEKTQKVVVHQYKTLGSSSPDALPRTDGQDKLYSCVTREHAVWSSLPLTHRVAASRNNATQESQQRALLAAICV